MQDSVPTEVNSYMQELIQDSLLPEVVVVEDGMIKWANESFAALLGYSPHELIHSCIDTLFHPDDTGWFFHNMENETERRSHALCAKAVCKDKRELLIQFDLLVKRMKGKSVAFIYYYEDITGQQADKASHADVEEQFRTAFHYAAVGMALASINGYLFECNYAMCELLAISDAEADMRQHQVSSLIHPEDLNAYYDGSSGLLIGEIQCFESELRFFRQQHVFWGIITMTLVRDHHGRPLHFIIQLQDISGKKEAEELLRKSDKLSAVGQLAAGVAHEVRNPLTVLKGFAQMLNSTDSRNEQYYRLMLSEVDRIEAIIGEFLMFARPQEVKFLRTDFRELMTNVSQLMQTKAVMNKSHIHIEYDCERTDVDCDANQMKQVFINMIQNALDAMPRGGEVAISVTKKDEEHIQIRIQDEGCGISEERISKLGEPFYSSKEKGTGIGLMISYQIIAKHRGFIKVESELDVGTTFEIVLPCQQTNIGGEVTHD